MWPRCWLRRKDDVNQVHALIKALQADEATDNVTAKNTPTQDDSTKKLATTEFVKAAGRLNRILVYRISGGVQQVSINGAAFTTTGAGAYTPEAGMKFIRAQAIGGGGAGAGAGSAAAGNVSLGGPGGAGAYGVGLYSAAEVGASKPVVVGAAGVPASNANGFAGGTSSIGALLSCPGGNGGQVFQNQVPPAVNGNGNTSSAPTGANLLSVVGFAGGATFASAANANAMVGGPGGSSHFGPGPVGPAGNSNGAAASNYGTGGSGCCITSGNAVAGGAGAPGVVIIEEYV